MMSWSVAREKSGPSDSAASTTASWDNGQEQRQPLGTRNPIPMRVDDGNKRDRYQWGSGASRDGVMTSVGSAVPDP
jgi:hypothetical protein